MNAALEMDERTPYPAEPASAHDAPPPVPGEPARAGERLPFQKNPALAGFLSLFPGMGNIYNGLYLRGLTFFLIVAGLIGTVNEGGPEIFGFAIAFFWIFNVIDAYRQATLINYGYAQDLGIEDRPKHPKASQGGLAAGVILVLIGLVALLDRWFVIDLAWLFDLWPVALLLVGGWLIWGSLRERRKPRQVRDPEY